MISACAARSARCFAMSCPAALTHAGRKRGELRVKLVPGHGQRAPPVTQPVGRFTGEIERVGNAGQAPRGRGRQGGPFAGRRWQA